VTPLFLIVGMIAALEGAPPARAQGVVMTELPDQSRTLAAPETTHRLWTPPLEIPSNDVLALHVEPIRQDAMFKAVVAMSERPEPQPSADPLASVKNAMLAGARAYAKDIGRMPEVKHRLHLLAWGLEPLLDKALFHPMARMPPETRLAFLAALNEAGMATSNGTIAEIVATLPPHATDGADLPAALRSRLETLSQGLGRERYTRELRNHLDRDRAAQTIIAQARERMDDATRLAFLFRSMIGHFHPAGGLSDNPVARLSNLDALPPAYRVVWLVRVYQGELGNGGIEQFFSNSSGALAPETVAALRLLQLDAHAGEVETGISLFPKPFPRDRADLWSRPKMRTALSRLGARLELDEVQRALVAYAREQGIIPR
jgi:Domain of unknown function (DUF4375)